MPTCDICGKTFDKQGKLNLHRYHCKFKNGAADPNNQNVKDPKNGAADPNNKKCDHDFRLLNPKNVNEYNAMTNGYTEVCVKCQDLQ